MTSEVKFTDPRIAILLVSMIIFWGYMLIRFFKKKMSKIKIPQEVLMLLTFSMISYVLWEILAANYRYLIVLEFLSLLAIIAVIQYICAKTKNCPNFGYTTNNTHYVSN